MSHRKEIVFLVIGDFLALNAAWVVFYWLRIHSGWFLSHHAGLTDVTLEQLPLSALFLYGYWTIVFLFFGLYRPWYVRAPSDEIITLLKTLGVGTLLLSLIIWWDPTNTASAASNDPRILGLTYWFITSIFCVGTRSLLRYSQRRLLESGIGTRASIVIGDAENAKELASMIEKHPRLGYNVVGFVTADSLGIGPDLLSIERRNRRHTGTTQLRSIPRLGTTAELEAVIDRHDVKEVLITVGSNEHEKLMDVIARASKSNAGLKIVPDLYDIVSGQARTRQIYGFPLIDINPILLRPWEETAKRALDVVISAVVLVLGLPVWLLLALAIRLSSAGPVLFSQDRVGKGGKLFNMHKFRSMQQDAEGGVPVYAVRNDPRVTRIGWFMRKTHLDEVPQFWNVLKGDMSLVGPRPEREFFVKQLIQEIPYYNRRHKVRPGITGLYQAMFDKYDENLDDVRQRVKHDLMYIESISLRLDVKILFRTAYIMVRGKGQA